MSYSLKLVAVGAAVFACVLWYWKRTGRSIAYLPGPPSSSWLIGNIPDFQRAEDVASADFEWTKKYGNAFRVKGCLGENILYLSDPKALQYVFNTGGYGFPKTWEMLFRLRLISGRGMISADGVRHARHRRVMNPSFSYSALKGYLPLFFTMAQKTVDAWKETIVTQQAEKPVVDVLSSLGRTTLDIIGEAAFGYKFQSIDSLEPKTDLHRAYDNLHVDTNYMASDFSIVFLRILGYAPLWLLDIVTLLPKSDFKRFNNYMNLARNVAKDIVEKQMHAHSSGKEGGKDVMSIFVKANHAEDPKRRLEEDEILSQITTLMLAGHDTTSKTLSWALYELSKHPEVQRKVRDEIRATRSDVAARDDSELTISDLESMNYTIAVLKETLRYHPIAVELSRRAAHDDVIPLLKPLQTITGETITAIPIHKGQVLQLGVASYNRLTDVWGPDAEQWRPERFMEEIPNTGKTGVGVYGNIATFGSGVRSCIGWRFALLEIQIILINLIENFEFNPAPKVEMRRVFGGLMQSMVKGQEGNGAQMPLAVSILPENDGK